MSEISIHIRIGQREYPMKVLPKEEQTLRESAQQLNEQLQWYAKQFHLHDYQDVMAMAAFDLTVERTKGMKEKAFQAQGIYEQVRRMQRHIDGILEWEAALDRGADGGADNEGNFGNKGAYDV